MLSETATRRWSEVHLVEGKRDIRDVIVVGAGPAGLTAAIYLGRFRRRCLVLEDGHSRARWIPTSHNIPGFTAGIGGNEFLITLQEQALQYGAQVHQAHVSSVVDNDGTFALQTGGGTLYTRYVLLASGVRDHLPDIKGVSEALSRGLLRVCPICDAFEAIGRRIAVISDGDLGEREAKFLTSYTDQVTLLCIASSTSASTQELASSRGIERISITLAQLEIKDDRVTLSSAQGERDFDVAYLALGWGPYAGGS